MEPLPGGGGAGGGTNHQRAGKHVLGADGGGGRPGHPLQQQLHPQVDALCEVNAQGWWEAPKLLKDATLAWEGRNEAHSPICLYDMPWQNPRPDLVVASIEIISGNSDAIPIIAGLTLTR